MPVKVPWSLPAARPAYDGEDAPVLLSSDPDHPAVKARLEAGDRVISAPDPSPGDRLVDAVAMMDKLRTSGPWESEQTHETLRRYLLEETYEVFDAVHSGNADELREELGDVLLQVLFHARIAEDAPQHPFTIDDVADSLVRKLGNRVPAVLAGEPISLEEQLAQWEERKALEKAGKARFSSIDDVPTAQPALALAQKVIDRVSAAGVPADLIPESMTSVSIGATVDAENSLRSSVLEFMDTVRRVEHAIAAGRRGEDVPEELDVAHLGQVTEEEWRGYWPTAAVPEADEAQAEDTEPAPDRIPEPTPADVPEPGPVEVPEPSPTEVPEPSPSDPPEDVSTEEALADESEANDGGQSAEKFTA
jgi:XTP/dITP diphosphohydrolase